MKRLQDLVHQGATALVEKTDYTKEMAQQIARSLISHATKKSFAELLADYRITSEQQSMYESYLHRMIVDHEPLAYIIETVFFLSLCIHVKKPILIPRVETEYCLHVLFEYLEEHKIKPKAILDMCTGTGCIALAFSAIYRNASIVAVDIDPEACALARYNRDANDDVEEEDVEIVESDLFSELDINKKFDLIISNPPYVSVSEYAVLDPSIKYWEARHALYSDKDGLAMTFKIIETGFHYLSEYGMLGLEINERHAELLMKKYSGTLFKNVFLIKDQYQKPRFLLFFK